MELHSTAYGALHTISTAWISGLSWASMRDLSCANWSALSFLGRFGIDTCTTLAAGMACAWR
ncbi:hypothetical protein D3C86_2191430 [compost metagenome]